MMKFLTVTHLKYNKGKLMGLQMTLRGVVAHFLDAIRSGPNFTYGIKSNLKARRTRKWTFGNRRQSIK